MSQSVRIERKTKETQIILSLNLESNQDISIETPLPFFNHMLLAMAFHGQFSLQVKGQGDVDVDPHHLVEDLGLVLGQAFLQYREGLTSHSRYGRAVIPMDEALSEVVIDAGGRPYCVYEAHYPQSHAGQFDLSLVREFLHGLSQSAKMNLHAHCRYGENGHHMVEALFKALGKALKEAHRPVEGGQIASTKGSM